MIPVSAVEVPEAAHELMSQVLTSGRLAQGPMVERFEALMAEAHGVTHAVAVSNGTVSLVDALEALGVGPGDEVVTSAFTFVATLNAILETGATATFADIDPDGFGLSPDSVAAMVDDATAAVMPVHLYGQPADLPGIVDALGERTIPMVEDAAQAHGAAIGDRPVGSWGVGSFSFYATKNVTTGEGGCLTTDDDAVAERLRLLRNQGMRARYEYVLPGHNHRMTEMQAALGIPQLERLGETNRRRAANAEALSERLGGLDGLVLPAARPGTTHVWHQYTVRVTPEARVDRDALGAALAERGVGSGIYYPRLVFDYDCYRSHPRVRPSEVPNAAAAAAEVLSLPVHPGLTTGDLDSIAVAVREVLEG